MFSGISIKQMLVTAGLLALFAVIGAGLVALTFTGTRERVARNEHAELLDRLKVLVPPGSYDNDIADDTIEVTAPALLGSKRPIRVYRARKHGQPVAAILTPIAPDGYSGDIVLLVGVLYDGKLSGVRVLEHHETPGLGDNIEAERSDWIKHFTGRSLTDPPPAGWKVKRDGGVFDQFTGATITPRAVVKAVYQTLIYFRSHRQALFASGAAPSGH